MSESVEAQLHAAVPAPWSIIAPRDHRRGLRRPPRRASRAGLFHPDGLVVDYGAAKAALLNTSSVSPGPVATDLWLGDHGVAAALGEASGTDPAPRTGNVTGSNYVIDGGLVKTM